MSYSRGGSGSGPISGLTDAALSNPAEGQVLAYNATLQKWQNGPAPAAVQASASTQGTVKLAGDLSGTAALPVVAHLNGSVASGFSLPSAAPTTGQVLTATSATATGWSTPSGSGAVTSVAGRTGAVTLAESDITNLTADLTAKAADTAVVHLAGAETITGAKTFSGVTIVPTPTAGTHAATKAYVDSAAGSGTATDAAAGVKGVVALSGDLAGTAASPTVPGLAGKAAKGANGDITSLTGLTTALSLAQGGTGATTAAGARTSLGLGSAATLAAGGTSGVATLDSNALVPRAQLGSGTASASTVLYGDGAWRAPAAASNGYSWTAVKTANYTVASGDAVIVDASSAAVTITLPTNLGANAFVRVKKIDATVNAVIITSSATIDNNASMVLNNQYASQDFSYTGSIWYAV